MPGAAWSICEGVILAWAPRGLYTMATWCGEFALLRWTLWQHPLQPWAVLPLDVGGFTLSHKLCCFFKWLCKIVGAGLCMCVCG